jgi:hypothetical protein
MRFNVSGQFTLLTLVSLGTPSWAGEGPVGGEMIDAKGAFSCDLVLDLAIAGNPGPLLERDRIWMQQEAEALKPIWAEGPGMLQKHNAGLPAGPTLFAGGSRYLFNSRLLAARYETFVLEEFEYPAGVLFTERPEFSSIACNDWGVVAAWRFLPVETETALRTERYETGLQSAGEELVLRLILGWLAPGIVAEGEERGYAEVQVLHSAKDHQVQIVYAQPRTGPTSPDEAALGRLLSDPPLGGTLVGLGLTPTLDTAQLILNTWLPYASGDSGAPALWPNSPPFPAPFCGDGVCIPSRGETASTCAADCAAGCGDGTCTPLTESQSDCPVDCTWAP